MSARVLYLLDDITLVERVTAASGGDFDLEPWNGTIETTEAAGAPGEEPTVLLVDEDQMDPLRLAAGIHATGRDLPMVVLGDRDGRVTTHGTRVWRGDPQSIADHLRDRILRYRRRLAADRALAGQRLENLVAGGRERVYRTYLEQVLEHAPVGVVLLGDNSQILSINRYGAEIFGTDHATLLGTDFFDRFSADQIGKLSAAREAGLRPAESAVEATVVDGLGQQRHVTVRIVPWSHLGDGPAQMVILVDITERKRTEAQLHQAQKMEAIGQLTGGVAHDFNNLLQVVMGSLEMIEHARDDKELKRHVDNATQAVDKGAALTNHLLSFSRRQTLNPRAADANELVAEALNIIERTLGENVSIVTEFAEAPLPIDMDTALLGTALLNLSLNARDAMPGGGTLTISTSLLAATETHDRQVCIRISDTGVGIPEEHLDRVMEPFFTTKEIGSGSGLGLSMVYGFVQQSNGRLEIESTEGKGTTVTLAFPLTESPSNAKAADHGEPSPDVAAAAILVVEDDPDVRTTTTARLRRLGYEVMEAEDGRSAKDMLAGGAGGIDLVFTDVVMPGGVSGLDLADWVAANHPNIRVLLTSGYPDLGGGDTAARTGVRLLAKPYRRRQLAEAVAEALAD